MLESILANIMLSLAVILSVLALGVLMVVVAKIIVDICL